MITEPAVLDTLDHYFNYQRDQCNNKKMYNARNLMFGLTAKFSNISTPSDNLHSDNKTQTVQTSMLFV